MTLLSKVNAKEKMARGPGREVHAQDARAASTQSLTKTVNIVRYLCAWCRGSSSHTETSA